MQITITQALPVDLSGFVSPVSVVLIIGGLFLCVALWRVLNPPRRRF